MKKSDDRSIENHFRLIFLKLDCQINLYGSILFECCLEKPGIMDVDVQFERTFQYDTLKELIDIINKSGLLCSSTQ